MNNDGNPAYTCDICQKVLKTKAELLEHSQKQHKEILGNHCGGCDKIFQTEEELNKH